MPRDLSTLTADFGRLNEIVQTVTLACALWMTREQIVAALKPTKEGGPLPVPEEQPLDAYTLEDGPKGPIPERVEFKDFVWQGGPLSWRVKLLRRFATFTHGSASFILVDVDGGMHPYEIEDGKLFVCDVGLIFARRTQPEKSMRLQKAAPLFRAGVAQGQRLAKAAA